MLVERLRRRRWERETLAEQRATAVVEIFEVSGVRVLQPEVPNTERPWIGSWTVGVGLEVVAADAPVADLAAALDAALTASQEGGADPMGAVRTEVLEGLGVRSDRALKQRGLILHVKRTAGGAVEVEPSYPCGGGWVSEPEQRVTIADGTATVAVAEVVVAMHDDMATRRPQARRV